MDWVGFQGRMARRQFIVRALAIWGAYAACIGIAYLAISGRILFAPLLWVAATIAMSLVPLFLTACWLSLVLIVRRLHDMGFSGRYVYAFILLPISLWALPVHIPDMSALLRAVHWATAVTSFLFLALSPGDDGANGYGSRSGE